MLNTIFEYGVSNERELNIHITKEFKKKIYVVNSLIRKYISINQAFNQNKMTVT